jgi:hypothetical protein
MSVRNNRTVKPAITSEVSKSDKKITSIEDLGAGVDVQYNPEILNSVLQDLELQVNAKCAQIQKDADFMCTSIKQAFHLELIKLPNQVKTMSLERFRSEFGDSLEAVTRGAMGMGNKVANSSSRENHNTNNRQASSSSSSSKSSTGSHKSSSSSSNPTVFQTPSGSKSKVAQTPGTVVRKPREGEVLLSANGSPLGAYEGGAVIDGTAVKSRVGPAQTPTHHTSSIVASVPATPGTMHVPLSSGGVVVVDLEGKSGLDDASIAGMSKSVKLDALAKMQAMMANMQSLMEKLQK